MLRVEAGPTGSLDSLEGRVPAGTPDRMCIHVPSREPIDYDAREDPAGNGDQ